jgi:antitoxin FitA
MPQLLVRNVPESIAKKLKLRAAEHGVSAEEEHRRILREVLELPGKKPNFIEHLMSAPVLEKEDEWMFDRNDPRMKQPERPPLNFED